MFIRAELKSRAKNVLDRWYFEIMIVGVIVMLICNFIGFNTKIDQFGGTHFFLVLLGYFEFEIFDAPFIGILLGAIFLFSVFIVNPLEVGYAIYHRHKAEGFGNKEDVLYAFKDGNYGRVWRTMLMQRLSIFLWSLLFLIPGIIKAYSYYLVPYLLEEHPEMNYREILAKSTEMTRGFKFEIFVFDLSFILWYILGGITFNIATYLYVYPYVSQSRAQLFLEISRQRSEIEGLSDDAGDIF